MYHMYTFKSELNIAIVFLTNSISYGYEDDESHRIEVVVRRESDSLVIVVTDDSIPFDVAAGGAQADIDSGLEDREIGGLGIFLVHQMMDEVEYERVDGRNVVTLTKRTADAG